MPTSAKKKVNYGSSSALRRPVMSCSYCLYILGSLSNDDGDCKENVKKAKQQLCTPIISVIMVGVQTKSNFIHVTTPQTHHWKTRLESRLKKDEKGSTGLL